MVAADLKYQNLTLVQHVMIRKDKYFISNCFIVSGGIIQKICLKDFMCHEDFSWEPNRNVNFVTGANGSGKSSILQGNLEMF